MPALGQVNKEIKEIKLRHDERELFTSQISDKGMKSANIQESIIPRLLSKLENGVSGHLADQIRKDVAWLLDEICKAVEEDINSNLKTNQGPFVSAQCKPLLVGSASEFTQT